MTHNDNIITGKKIKSYREKSRKQCSIVSRNDAFEQLKNNF